MMPGLYSERMGPIDVVIDTSGSIDGPTLNAFAAEIRAIANSARPEKIRVIYCDADINHVDEFGPNDDLTIEPHGGGGTDFRPIFAKNAADGYAPAALVYLTDLYGPQPADAPDYPVLWCCTTNVTGAFGETVKLEL
jgi:predicted metal-dependent peptidase